MRKLRMLCYFLLLGVICFDNLGTARSLQLPKEKAVLFICTGNLYRSRFAEALFNFYGSENKSGWKAFSRGLDLTSLTSSQKKLKVSGLVIEGLGDLGIPFSFADGQPTQLTQNDLEQSDYIVALNRQEHQFTLEKTFPSQKSKIHYWEIGDSKTIKPAEAIRLINGKVKALLNSLE